MAMAGRTVVMYHYPCADGIYSALAAELAFRKTGTVARFIPLTVYKDTKVEDLHLQGDEDVYMCDFSGHPGFAVSVAQQVSKLTILDHHKTAQQIFEGPDAEPIPPNMEVHFDMSRSGARIALDWWKPQVSPAVDMAFKCVEDADLWRWSVDGSKEFHAGLASLKLEYSVVQNPGIFDILLSLDPEQVKNQGKKALEEEACWIDSMLAASYTLQLGGTKGASSGWGRCLAVEIDTDMSHHRSRLGNELAAKSAKDGLMSMSAIAYREKEMEDISQIKLSLRGCGDVDTTLVSAALGGGGHKLASSCIIPVVDFEAWRD